MEISMSFPDAIRYVTDGLRITKLEWGNENIWVELKDGHLKIHKEDNIYHDLIVSDGDLVGLDWTILQSP